MNLLSILALALYIICICLLLHHYLIHGYLFDLHDIQFLKIKSHEFWIFILFTSSIFLHQLSSIVKIRLTRRRILYVSIGSLLLITVIISSLT